MRKTVILTILILSSFFLSSQTVEGKWKTYNDQTGKAESTVEIFIKDQKLYGKIIDLVDVKEGDKGYRCTNCSGDMKNKKILGMVIIQGLEKDGDEWKGDDAVFYPAHDKHYDCKIWLDKNNKDVLYLRGYYGFMYRTQAWKRIK